MKVQSKSYKFWRFVLYVVLIALALAITLFQFRNSSNND